MKLNKSALNFVWLFFSSIAIKGLGILRESMVAYSIGNTIEFATFNTLRSVVDFFLAFLIGIPVVESILVPKYAHEYLKNNKLSFQPIWKQTILFSKYLFLASLFLLSVISFTKSENYTIDVVYWIILFSIYLALQLSSSVLFSLQKTIGNFQKFSTQSFIISLITLILIFSMIGYWGLKSLLISSILGLLISNLMQKRDLRQNFNPGLSEEKKHPINLNDINFYKFIAVNHAVFIGYAGRILISFGNNDQINLYQYSFIIISSFMLIVVSNISSVILYRTSTSASSILGKTILTTLLLTLGVNVILFFFGNFVISVIYEHGKFSSLDTLLTFEFLKIFLIPYTFFALTQVMIQPFLLNRNSSNSEFNILLKRIGQIIFVSIALAVASGVYLSDYETGLLVLLYLSSISLLFYLGLQLKKLNTQKLNSLRHA